MSTLYTIRTSKGKKKPGGQFSREIIEPPSSIRLDGSSFQKIAVEIFCQVMRNPVAYMMALPGGCGMQ
jgi:hypothetical protein